MIGIKEIYRIVRENCRQPKIMAVAGAADETVLEAVLKAWELRLTKAVLFGSQKDIEPMLKKLRIPREAYELVNVSDMKKVSEEAVKLVSEQKADLVMKGKVQSGEFIQALLNKQFGLKAQGRILSSLAFLETDQEEKRFFVTDPGFIPEPDLEMKKKIIENAVEILRLLGIENPNVAVLSATEQINPKLRSSYEGRMLQEMNESGIIQGCKVCGPLSLDLAVSSNAVKKKGYCHPVAGKADVLLVPSLETGNIFLKSLTCFAKLSTTGIVAGTTAPVVFTSRADSVDTKLNTIAMAVLLAMRKKEGKDGKDTRD